MQRFRRRCRFPGFPEPGDYRIFVQVKRAGRVITQPFDVTVGPGPLPN